MKALARCIRCSVLAGILLAGSASGAGEGGDVDLLLQVPIDVGSATLSATIWKPGKADRPLDTILVLTPYIADEEQGRARKYVDAGYAYVAVDVRGRGLSGGSFTPYFGDGADACRVIEWIRSMPWSSGRVAMRGGSYRGMVQWQAAKHCVDLISAMAPTSAPYPGYDFPHLKGVLPTPYNVQWLSLVAGNTRNDNLFSDERFWRGKYLQAYLQHVPFHRLDELCGIDTPVFDAWLQHVADPEFWRPAQLQSSSYTGIDIPILTITGQFDGNQPGSLRYYAEHMQFGPERARQNHYLVIGPWGHSETRYPKDNVGGLAVGKASLVDIDKFQIEWFDWVLKGKHRPRLLRERIAYYVVGSNEWRYATDLEHVTANKLRYLLSAPQSSDRSVFHSGRLITEWDDSAAPNSEFTSDPLGLHPWNKMGEEAFEAREEYLIDQTLAFHSNAIVFHSAPLDIGMTVTGRLELSLYVSLDTPDSDIQALVHAVHADGKVTVLGEDFVRVRFREGTEPLHAEAGEVYRLDFDGFYWQAVRLEAGARIRLVLLPLNSPFVQRSYNSGGRIGYETIDDARTAHITVHHNERYPSILTVPFSEER